MAGLRAWSYCGLDRRTTTAVIAASTTAVIAASTSAGAVIQPSSVAHLVLAVATAVPWRDHYLHP